MPTATGSPVKTASACAKSAACLIGGAWAEGEGTTLRRICNPADRTELVAAVHEASGQQVDVTCDHAAAAFPGWRAVPPPDRTRIIFRYRELLEAHFNELAELLVRENGKLLSEARG